jgi:plasmid stabilization system protein ParE
MALSIEWSKQAQKSLDDLYDFLETNWAEQIIKNFTKKLESKLRLIRHNPTLYKSSAWLEGTRECIVTRHNTIFYQYVEGESKIFIVSFWANYKNPDNLKG